MQSKTIFPFSDTGIYETAVVGAKTAHGGEVTGASSNSHLDHCEIALVGDTVSYPDGRTARITSGAGEASCINGIPFAIVGSHVEGGDRIVSTPVHGSVICLDSKDPLPEGFLVEGYLSSPYAN